MNNNETCIGKIVYSKLPIEWMRYNMYAEEDKYRSIPMLVFRVQASCPRYLIENLKQCVDGFKGKSKWTMFKDPLSKKGNYLITIFELEEFYQKSNVEEVPYNPIDYFGIEKYKEYCDSAIHDMPMLAKHISDTL